MSRVRVEWRGDEFLAAFHSEVVPAAVNAAAVAIETTAANLLNQRSGPSAPGQPPGVVDGVLRSSVTIDPATASDPTARVGTNQAYGRYLEYGTIIHAKGKKLTVPVNTEARDIRTRNTDLKTVGLKLVVIRGVPMLIRPKAKGKAKTLDVMFILKDRVVVEPRPWLRPALEQAKSTAQSDAVREAEAAMRRVAARFTGSRA